MSWQVPPSTCATDVHTDRDAYPALKARLLVELGEHSPERLGDRAVARVSALDTGDGFKFWVDDGSWLLVRFSGTEPLVRVYAEASSARCAMRCSARASAWSVEGRRARERRPGGNQHPRRPCGHGPR